MIRAGDKVLYTFQRMKVLGTILGIVNSGKSPKTSRSKDIKKILNKLPPSVKNKTVKRRSYLIELESETHTHYTLRTSVTKYRAKPAQPKFKELFSKLRWKPLKWFSVREINEFFKEIPSITESVVRYRLKKYKKHFEFKKFKNITKYRLNESGLHCIIITEPVYADTPTNALMLIKELHDEVQSLQKQLDTFIAGKA